MLIAYRQDLKDIHSITLKDECTFSFLTFRIIGLCNSSVCVTAQASLR